MRTLHLSDSNYRFLKRILERRNNNNNSPSPSRRHGERRAEKTQYLNRNLRRVYRNTNRNRHFVYTGPEGRKVRTYTEIFSFKNDWNQIRRLRTREPRGRRGYYRERY